MSKICDCTHADHTIIKFELPLLWEGENLDLYASGYNEAINDVIELNSKCTKKANKQRRKCSTCRDYHKGP